MTEESNTGVKILRLNTGEDIIANCILDDDSNSVIVNNPMKVVITRAGSLGKTMLLMMPWLPLELVEEDLAAINYDDIITIVNPKNSFIEYYTNTVDQYQAALLSKEEDINEEFEGDEEEFDEDTMKEMLDSLKLKRKSRLH